MIAFIFQGEPFYAKNFGEYVLGCIIELKL